LGIEAQCLLLVINVQAHYFDLHFVSPSFIYYVRGLGRVVLAFFLWLALVGAD
jgi:hypothetical protein